MAVLKKFEAIRPRTDLASRIAALPYDVYNRKEAKEETAKEQMSFLKIDRPETQFGDDVDTYDSRVYNKAKEILEEMEAAGEFVRDREPSYYLYELTMDGRTQTGIVGCASIDDYINGVIKKHENTRAEKEQDRICHVDTCDTQTGPIFLAYRKNDRVKEVIQKAKEQTPIFDFISPDGIGHKGYKISDMQMTETIRKEFEKTESLYIADGHHRAASAVKVGLKRREENPDNYGNEEYQYFLSVLFSEEELMILDYNRVIMDLNGMSEEQLLKAIEKKFVVQKKNQAVKPERKGVFGMYLPSGWYRLEINPQFMTKDPVKGLDVSLLQEEILNPLLGIADPKTDKRIDFVGGIRGLEELEKRVKQGAAAAFSMFPTSIQELFDVADANLLMPPKSTWFEPKLRSGLFLHRLDSCR